MVYLAMLVAPWTREETAPARWPLRAIGAGVALLTVVVVAPLYVADRYLTKSYATENPWVALEMVERAQTYNPVNPQLPQREAELAIRIGDWPRAKQAYERAIRLNPEHYAPYTLLAKLHEQRGEPEEALSLYRQALTLNPLEEELSESVRRIEGQTEG
jgi:tetratricopeptide (TPR) repeat protein